MEYIKLFWNNAPDGEPIIILYEVDAEHGRWAHRSIDIFVDRHTHNIADLYDEVIEVVPIPTVEEFNSHAWGEEFRACAIKKDEFEAIWKRRVYVGLISESEK